MIYLFFIPVIIAQIFFAAYLYRSCRDDQTMFRFCGVRSDIINFLHSGCDQQLSDSDYTVARWLIEVTNLTTQEFDSVKHTFNMGSILRTMRYVDHNVVEPKSAMPVSNPKLAKLYGELLNCTVLAFRAYTPFLKSRILFYIIARTARFEAKSMLGKTILRAREFKERWTHLRSAEQRYWIPEHC